MIHQGIVDLSLIDKFPSGYPFRSYASYISNLVAMEGFIAVAGMLAPDLIEIEDHVFLAETFPMLRGKLQTRYGNDRKTIERYVNLFCASDFYMRAGDETSASEEWQLVQVSILQEFWQRRLREVFPEREFDFEITTSGLFDEDGVCLTFSQR